MISLQPHPLGRPSGRPLALQTRLQQHLATSPNDNATTQCQEVQGSRQTLTLPGHLSRVSLITARRAVCEVRLNNPDWSRYLKMSDPPGAMLEKIWGCQASPVLSAATELRLLMQFWDTSPHLQCCAAEFLRRVLEWSQLCWIILGSRDSLQLERLRYDIGRPLEINFKPSFFLCPGFARRLFLAHFVLHFYNSRNP